MAMFYEAKLFCCALLYIFFIGANLGVAASRPLLAATGEIAEEYIRFKPAHGWRGGGQVICSPGDEAQAVQLLDAILANDAKRAATLLGQYQGVVLDDIFYTEPANSQSSPALWPLLWIASFLGHADIIKVLLSRQVRNIPHISTRFDEDGLLVQIGESALGVACHMGHVEAVQALLATDISLRICTLAEIQPSRSLWYCCCLCKPRTVFSLNYESILSTLPNKGPYASTIKALLQAAEGGHMHLRDVAHAGLAYDDAAAIFCRGKQILSNEAGHVVLQRLFAKRRSEVPVLHDTTLSSDKDYWYRRAACYVPFGIDREEK